MRVIRFMLGISAALSGMLCAGSIASALLGNQPMLSSLAAGFCFMVAIILLLELYT